MKKIYYIVSLAILALFTACQDYNEKNFPGFDQAAIPTNLATYNYTLIDADYSNISKAALAISKTKRDSTVAKAISTNKYFQDTVPANNYVPLLLNTKYLYADSKSTAMITYNKNVAYDTTKITVAANKYTLLKDDYNAMGTTAGLPGQYDNFSSTIDPAFYIPIWLKINNPYSKSGDVKLIRYQYYTGTATVQNYTVFIYDGTVWSKYKSTVLVTEKYSFKDSKWQFINSEVFVEKFLKDFGQFTPVVVTGTYTWTWASFNGGCAVANAYQKGETEIWLVSPVIDLKERINPTLSFDYAINYGGSLIIPDLFGVYVSTDYATDVTKATWTKLDLTYPTTFSWTFINSGKLSLVKYANKKITIGFKYASAGTAIGLELSNVNLLDE